ncbi:Rne/Rng family ribonuclease [Roseomonas nepalensis]|uniref:Ribonuclease E n=1 Tax=Muricoccus nepalensis TaxID=1854500 RepID=A0A502FVW8_9PROT|nr:ribonuclease E/G [Roseomonas nepalensis]TPG53412.1 Rne/Rng family ribonuclease [Roseomonas nepalensis]
MTKRMLIDASHPEETRVVVLDGNRLEDFDLETQNRRPLKGNIYLAKIVRVEPSLQAAFVEYGGNRHGFLAFGEIHPDYYQIPVADRQRLLEAQAQEAAEEDPEDEIETAAERVAPRDDADLARPGRDRERDRDRGRGRDRDRNGRRQQAAASAAAAVQESADAALGAEGEEPAPAGEPAGDPGQETAANHPETTGLPAGESFGEDGAPATPAAEETPAASAPESGAESPAEATIDATPASIGGETGGGEDGAPAPRAQPMTMHVDRVSEGDPVAEAAADEDRRDDRDDGNGQDDERAEDAGPLPETVGGDDREDRESTDSDEERRERRIPSKFLRHYKIQEVIRRRQVILVQVVKEERGNKGAALTSYISLPGRFSVLMPNSPKGGGVSRKISSATDRKRLREVIDEVGLPRGMGIIVRTAGAQRPKPEIRRDCEYLLRLWDDIRTRTLSSTAPALVYEEADLLKRSIRDNFAREIEEIQIEGEEAFRQARDFTRMLMPQNERKVKLYRDPGMPLFARMGVEQQLDAMMSPTVQLRSGGYIVINQTEALVSIDVNSGRATRDRHIEDTALRTNLEAADEIARQLRLRDLAGLIVIDFIDMESSRNDAMVERRMKEALQHDRARIQVGRISHFGLLEMSRQRLRPSLTEHSFVTCPHCQGLGIVRSDESAALHVLRAIEEEGARRRAAEIVVHCSPAVAMHILNRKRERLAAVESRHAMCVLFEPDAAMTAAQNRIERTRPQTLAAPPAAVPALRMDYAPEPVILAGGGDDEEEEEILSPEEAGAAAAPVANGEAATAEDAGERGRRRRRRRRGGRREDGAAPGTGAEGEAEDASEDAPEAVAEAPEDAAVAGAIPNGEERAAGDRPEAEGDARRRRGRRGGRRRREEGDASRADGDASRADGEAPRAADQAAPGAGDASPAPRYTGPTPADPFGGTYDALMDTLDAVEEAEAPRSVREIPIAAESPAPVAAEPPALAAPEPVAEPVATAPAEAPVAEAPVPAAPEPAPAAPSISEAPPVPAVEAGRAEPVAGTVVQPVLLGTEAPAAPAKKGWWRR